MYKCTETSQRQYAETCIPIDNARCQDPSRTFHELWTFIVLLYHHYDRIMSAIKACSMMIEDTIHVDGWVNITQAVIPQMIANSCSGGLQTYFHQFIATFINLLNMHLPSTHCDMLAHCCPLTVSSWRSCAGLENPEQQVTLKHSYQQLDWVSLASGNF